MITSPRLFLTSLYEAAIEAASPLNRFKDLLLMADASYS